jgi:ubiquinone/menaquinone biosynthesis C-methylase UbiE
LEIGPGPYSGRIFGQQADTLFVGVDVESPLTNCLCDVMHLAIACDVFDLVVCYHVLEHVPDDHGALRELWRVLKPGGVALIQVPIDRDVTLEAQGATSAQGRARLFGQSDHLSAYGLDFEDRLKAADFTVHIESFVQDLHPRIVKRMALDPAERVYACHKLPGSTA